MNVERLRSPAPPWRHTSTVGEARLRADLLDLERRHPGEYAVRVARGGRMRTRAGLFAELAAALQFAGSFGDNLDALRDALGDTDGIAASAVTLVIGEAAAVLADEPAETRAAFWKVIDAVLAERNAVAGHAARPLHVIELK